MLAVVVQATPARHPTLEDLHRWAFLLAASMPPQQRAKYRKDDDGFAPARSSKPNRAPPRRSSFPEDPSEGPHTLEGTVLDSGRHTQHVPGRLSGGGNTVEVDIFSAEAMNTPILTLVEAVMSSVHHTPNGWGMDAFCPHKPLRPLLATLHH